MQNFDAVFWCIQNLVRAGRVRLAVALFHFLESNNTDCESWDVKCTKLCYLSQNAYCNLNILYMDVVRYGAWIALQNLNKQTFKTKMHLHKSDKMHWNLPD